MAGDLTVTVAMEGNQERLWRGGESPGQELPLSYLFSYLFPVLTTDGHINIEAERDLKMTKLNLVSI